VPQADPQDGLAGKPLSWLPSPSLYILIHEPPARRYSNQRTDLFVHWHYNRGNAQVSRKNLKRDRQQFISPILFVDGHTARHDFTRVIKGDPDHPYEPTKDWIWYKPAEPPPIRPGGHTGN
jgi:hypothetical protein